MKYIKCKSIAYIAVFILIGSFWGYRVCKINEQYIQIEKESYNKLDGVQLGDSKLTEVSHTEGYEIKVISKCILDCDDFLRKYASADEIMAYTENVNNEYLLKPDKVYLITVKLKNNSSEESIERGIDWLYMYLYYKNIVLDFDSELYGFANRSAGGSTRLSLKPNTEMEFYLPYGIYQNLLSTDIEDIKDVPFQMVLSLWPTMKVVEI